MPDQSAEMSPEAKEAMMKRLEKHDAAQVETLGLPPGAEEREQAAAAAVSRVREAAAALITSGMIQAAGYRVVVKPIEGTKGLEEAEAEALPTLAAAGFEAKSEAQKKREERGENLGVVMHIGPVAFEGRGGAESWCNLGDLIIFARYVGIRVEHPRGSGNFYQIINDEDVFGRYA